MNVSLLERIDTKSGELKDSINSAKIWALVLYIAFAGAMFGTIARGFGWI
jgi:hypothetical protein